MKIGIVTPSYNQGIFLEQTIQSVINQTRKVDYYAIYDSCSSDCTSLILNKYKPKVTKIIIEKDGGQAAALNRGFSEMPKDIEIMGYLNSDDLLISDAVESVLNIFTNNPDVDFVTGWRRVIGPRGRSGMIFKSFARSASDMLIDSGINQESTFWRRSLYDRAGGYIDKSYRFAMDYDLWLRMMEAGWTPVYLPKVIGKYRLHPSSKSTMLYADIGLQEINRLRSLRHMPNLTLSEITDKILQMHRSKWGYFSVLLFRILQKLTNKILLPYYL
jgi:GT2 family glycosyltransferase